MRGLRRSRKHRACSVPTPSGSSSIFLLGLLLPIKESLWSLIIKPNDPPHRVGDESSAAKRSSNTLGLHSLCSTHRIDDCTFENHGDAPSCQVAAREHPPEAAM